MKIIDIYHNNLFFYGFLINKKLTISSHLWAKFLYFLH